MPTLTPKLSSLSIFFPFFNDAGTVIKAIGLAYKVGQQVTEDLEVIAIHGGASQDATAEAIHQAKHRWPHLKVIDDTKNTEGYAVIKRGFQAATKAWVFYTDGDLQYRVEELTLLVAAQHRTHAQVVNGYKVGRADTITRRVLGEGWRKISQHVFHLPIRDVDCDFRLIEMKSLKKIRLQQSGAAVLEELILQLQKAGARFAEVPVTHQSRQYGSSNYSSWQLVREKLMTFKVHFIDHTRF